MEYKRFSIDVVERPVSIVAGLDGKESFQGYAVVWFDRSKPGTEYIRPFNNGPKELHTRILASAFDGVLETQRIEAWYNHDPARILGSTPNSLSLTRDHIGLRFNIPFDPNDEDHRFVKSKIDKGIIQGASFQAGAMERFYKEGNYYVGEIFKIEELLEVSICPRPAFPATSATIHKMTLTY